MTSQVMRVTPNSPSHKAGLAKHDVIVTINGKPARSVDDIYERLETESQFVLDVRRGSQRVTIKVTPEEIS